MATGEWVWVLEGFRDKWVYERWPLPGLQDEAVLEHLGWLPDGLAEVNEPLLEHLRAHHGIKVRTARYEQLIIGRESL